MEPTSTEQKDKESREELLPPEKIGPLGRALQQHFEPYMEKVPDSIAKNELKKKLLELQTRKVKLVAGPDPDFPTWGLECFGEEENITIPSEAIHISVSLMHKLGPALQDYIISDAVAAGMPSSAMNYFRDVTRSLEINIINNAEKSTIKLFRK